MKNGLVVMGPTDHPMTNQQEERRKDRRSGDGGGRKRKSRSKFLLQVLFLGSLSFAFAGMGLFFVLFHDERISGSLEEKITEGFMQLSLDKMYNKTTNSESADATGSSEHFRPHIIFIVLDDLGSHDLGMHGSGIHTPTCDELARSGVYLSNSYVLPSCSATRCAIFSGRYPVRTGVHDAIWPESTQGLPLDEETLPEVLAKAGYQRHAVGKWHMGHSSWKQTPTFRGFESFYGFYHGGEDYFTHVCKVGYDLRFDKKEFCGENCSEIVDERGHYGTHLFTREAIRAIQKHKEQEESSKEDKPLFLYLAYQAVHNPAQAPPEYVAPYEGNSNFTELRKIYAGMLTAADEGIQNVTDALKESGLWDNSLIVVTTDNGGPTEFCAVQGSSNYPLRGGKCTVWEGGTTGDAFLTGGAMEKLGFPTGRVIPHLFHSVDWLPTLANITGVTPQGKPLDGVNQIETLRGGNASREQIFVGYGRLHNHDAWYGPAIRFKEWKLIENSGGPDKESKKKGPLSQQGVKQSFPKWVKNQNREHGNQTDTYMLFNLEKDRAEEHDVAYEHPEMVKKLAAMMNTYKIGCQDQEDDPACPFKGMIKTEVGDTFFPWCSSYNTKKVSFHR